MTMPYDTQFLLVCFLCVVLGVCLGIGLAALLRANDYRDGGDDE